jgi:hypothetical protein
MTIGFFSVLYLSVFSFSFSPAPPTIQILCTTSENSVELYHRGGAPLAIDSPIRLIHQDQQMNFTIGDYLDNQSKHDSFWTMGESLTIPIPNLNGDECEITLINSKNNAVVFQSTLH